MAQLYSKEFLERDAAVCERVLGYTARQIQRSLDDGLSVDETVERISKENGYIDEAPAVPKLIADLSVVAAKAKSKAQREEETEDA